MSLLNVCSHVSLKDQSECHQCMINVVQGVLQEKQTDASLWNARRSVLVLMRLCQKNCRSTANPMTLSFEAWNVVIKRSNCKIINEAPQTRTERRTGRSLKKVSAGQEKAAYSSTNSCSSDHTHSGLQARGGEWLPEPGQQLNPKQTSPTTVESSSFQIPGLLWGIQDDGRDRGGLLGVSTACAFAAHERRAKSEQGAAGGQLGRAVWAGTAQTEAGEPGAERSVPRRLSGFYTVSLGRAAVCTIFPGRTERPHIRWPQATNGTLRACVIIVIASAFVCATGDLKKFLEVAWEGPFNHHSFMHLSGPAFFF